MQTLDKPAFLSYIEPVIEAIGPVSQNILREVASCD